MTAVPSKVAGAAHPRLSFDQAPLRIYWELTRACGLACRHCRAAALPHRDPAELDRSESLRLLERLTGFGAPLPRLVFTGGDPLMRPDLFELIAAARALGFGVSVAPSATPLLTGAAIERFAAAGVEAISLSLDGASVERHDAVRQIPGTFDLTLAAARAAAAAGLPFQINTLVSEETVDDLPAIYLLTTNLGAARWSLFFLVEVGRGTVLRQITPAAADQLLRWLGSLTRHAPPVVTTTEAPFYRRIQASRRDERRRNPGHGAAAGIRDGNGIMFISHTGEVHPSGFLPLAAGNVRTEDPVALYRESDLFRQLRRPDLFGGRCGHCEFHWHCGGSRARAYGVAGDPLGEDPLCDYQPRSPRSHRTDAPTIL